MMNEFIDRVEVHESTGRRCHKEQQIDIYFSFIGRVDVAELGRRSSIVSKEAQDGKPKKAKAV